MCALIRMLIPGFFSLLLVVFCMTAAAQADTTRPKTDTIRPVTDTLKPGRDSLKHFIPGDSIPIVAKPISHMARVDSIMKNHSPRKAALRSALIPGWGQIYNHRWWKVPIIYGALGISGSVFVYNLKNYKDLRLAYRGKYEAIPKTGPGGIVIPGDSTRYRKIRADLLPIDMNALRSYRDEFRRNIDYSVLAFILLWGLNVVDATVDAHLRPFDVSPDLTMRFNFGHSQMAGTNGVSLILALK